MVERYKFVGSGVTNSQGVAQLTHDANGNPLATPGYVGSGKGLTQMCASLDSPTAISSGSDLSETYEVYDCINYDPCTSDTTTNYGIVGGSKAFDTDKIVVTRTTNGECYLELDTNNSLTLSEYLGKNIKLEIGGIDAPSNVTIGIFQYVNGAWDRIISNGATSGTLSTNLSISASATRVRFRFITNNLNSNQSASFQSLKIYPI